MRLFMLMIFSMLSLVAFPKGKKNQVLHSKEQSKPLVIDGKSNDWQVPLIFNKKSGFYYGISNDKQNLYVEMKIKDPVLMQKILTLGFTIYIDPNAKAKNILGINYPEKGMMNRKKGKNRQKNKEPNLESRAERLKKFNMKFLTGMVEGQLVGFDEAGMEESYFGEDDIDALIQINNKGELIYEAKIPLKSIFKNPSSYLKGKPFSIVLETGYFNSYNGRNAEHMAGGFRSMDRYNRYGSPYGGGISRARPPMLGKMRQQTGSPAMQYMLEPTRLKIKKVVLNK